MKQVKSLFLMVALLIGAVNGAKAQTLKQLAADTWTATDTLTANLQKRYPATPFKDIKPSAIPGLFQVTMGKNIGYVEESGRYFLFGHLFDMQTQTDLTEVPKAAAETIDFEKLPLKQAIKIKKGNGKRVFAVFSDPDCPYCKQLENTLTRMTNYTEYVFLMPLSSIHPDAEKRSKNIWCAKDKVAAYQDWFLDGVQPADVDCKAPIAENVTLSETLGITGTPTLINAKGIKTSGALPRLELEQWLSKEVK